MLGKNEQDNKRNNIPPSLMSLVPYFSGNVTNSICFVVAYEHEIIESCLSRRSGTAAVWQRFNLKDHYYLLICLPLTPVINLSASSGFIRDQRKIVRVIALLKLGDKSIFINYRSVSVLPVSILERLIQNLPLDYWTKHKILSNLQFGFLNTRSLFCIIRYLLLLITMILL